MTVVLLRAFLLVWSLFLAESAWQVNWSFPCLLFYVKLLGTKSLHPVYFIWHLLALNELLILAKGIFGGVVIIFSWICLTSQLIIPLFPLLWNCLSSLFHLIFLGTKWATDPLNGNFLFCSEGSHGSGYNMLNMLLSRKYVMPCVLMKYW